jgi:hypothetical protein
VGGILANSTRPAEFIYDNMMNAPDGADVFRKLVAESLRLDAGVVDPLGAQIVASTLGLAGPGQERLPVGGCDAWRPRPRRVARRRAAWLTGELAAARTSVSWGGMHHVQPERLVARSGAWRDQ